MALAIALACACAVVLALSLVVMLSKGRNAVVKEAARELKLHDHGTSARGKYRGFRFVIDAGSPEELRVPCAYGSFLSSATSAAERMFKSLGAFLGIGSRNKVSLRMRVELRGAGDPAFDASSAAAEIRRFLAEKLERGSFRATSEETEVAVFLRELSPDDPASGAALLKELADRVVEAGEALRSGRGSSPPRGGSDASEP